MDRSGRVLFLEAREASRGLTPATEITAAVSNRLEALKVLSNSILREVEELRNGESIISVNQINFDEEVKRFECDLIRCALVRTGGKQRQAARLLNIKHTTLNAKIKRYGITPNGLSSALR